MNDDKHDMSDNKERDDFTSFLSSIMTGAKAMVTSFANSVDKADAVIESKIIPYEHINKFADENDIVPMDQATKFATTDWCKYKSKFELNINQCLNDEKLCTNFNEMMICHESELYESVSNTLPSLIERSLRLAGILKDSYNVETSIKWLLIQFMASAILQDMSNRYGLYIWSFFMKEYYDKCFHDDKADSISISNRHARVHGRGKKPVSCTDSLNNIFIAHFILLFCSGHMKH